MILLLDNYDSFTYNLYQYLAELGAEVAVYRNDAVSVKWIDEHSPTAIVLSPGPGRPEKAGIMNSLIETLAGKVPMLGVCLGHQALAQVHGGTIGYAPTLMHGKVSTVSHDGSVLFQGIGTPFTATRYHSLVVERKSFPREFIITAETTDGVIMAMQHRSRPLFGVQFHPESIMTPDGKTLLRNFLRIIHQPGKQPE